MYQPTKNKKKMLSEQNNTKHNKRTELDNYDKLQFSKIFFSNQSGIVRFSHCSHCFMQICKGCLCVLTLLVRHSFFPTYCSPNNTRVTVYCIKF